jgi:hypothetical protein
MSTALSFPTITGVTGAPNMPDLSEAANIQTALKYLYFGSTGVATNSDGIYGALQRLYVGNPTLAGNVTITGDLTVSGTTTTLDVANLLVEDKEIVIGNVASPTNTTANGGGIRLEAGTDVDKTITWDSTNTNWTSSEHWNLAANKQLKINNVAILDTNAPKSMATLMGYTSTATTGSSTTLTATSSYYQQFTGTLTHTVVLPVTSTLITGWTFHIVNNSTGNLTVNSSGGNAVIVVIPGTTAMVTCIGTTLTTAADWEFGLTDFSTYTGTGANVMATSPTLTTPTITGDLTGNGRLTATSPGSGTSGAVVMKAISGDATPVYLQFTNNAISTQWGAIGATATGMTYQAGSASTSPHVFSGTVTVPSGTSSIAPLKFNTGTTKLSTLQTGAIEYDGSIFYATPKVNNTTAGRGLIPSDQILILNSNFGPTTVTSNSGDGLVTNSFSALNKTLYLAASQAYFVDMSIVVFHNLVTPSACTASVVFSLIATSGTQGQITAISVLDSAALTGGTSTMEFFSGNANALTETIKSVSSASDQGYSILKWSGVISNSVAGNFAPQLTINATSGGGSTASASVTIQAGSYCKVTPLGATGSEINIGGWA